MVQKRGKTKRTILIWRQIPKKEKTLKRERLKREFVNQKINLKELTRTKDKRYKDRKFETEVKKHKSIRLKIWALRDPENFSRLKKKYLKNSC